MTWNAARWRHRNASDSENEALAVAGHGIEAVRAAGSRMVRKTSSPEHHSGYAERQERRAPSVGLRDGTRQVRAKPGADGRAESEDAQAIGRRSAGKQSETIDVDGRVAPASPTPTPMRLIRNCK